MKIMIQTPDFKAQKKLVDFVKANLTKLSVFGDRILEAEVLLKLDKSNSKENKICEVKLVIPGNDLFAQRQSGTFEDAVLKCVEAIRHQTHRWKDSVNEGKLRGSLTRPESEEPPL